MMVLLNQNAQYKKKQFKLNQGFTVFEVLLSMGILMMAVSVIANLELRSFMRVMKDRDEIEKNFLVKKELMLFFLRPQRQQKKSVKKLETPEIKFTTYLQSINPKSTLASLKHRLFLLRTNGNWKHDKIDRQIDFITFVVKQEQKKQEKKV